MRSVPQIGNWGLRILISEFSFELQSALDRIYPFLNVLLWPLAAVLCVLVSGAAYLAGSRPEQWSAVKQEVRKSAGRWASWTCIAAAIVLGYFVSLSYMPVGENYHDQIEGRAFVSESAGEGASLYQNPPYFAILEERDLESKVVVAKPFSGESMDRMLYEVRNAVQSKLNVYGQAPTVTVEDKGTTMEVVGRSKMLAEQRLVLDASDIKVRLTPLSAKGAKSNAFHVVYDASYTWSNSSEKEAMGRFSLTLPSALGTFRKLSAEVNGQPFDDPDNSGTLRWEGSMRPGEKATARIQYETDASGVYSLVPGSGMRKTKVSTITISAPEGAKFLKGSLPPTEAHGAEKLWKLSDVVSNQPITIAIPFEREKWETTAKALMLAPIAFLTFAIGLLLLLRGSLNLVPTLISLVIQLAATAAPLALVDFGRPVLAQLIGVIVSWVVVVRAVGVRAASLSLCAGAVSLSAFAGPWTLVGVVASVTVALWVSGTRDRTETAA